MDLDFDLNNARALAEKVRQDSESIGYTLGEAQIYDAMLRDRDATEALQSLLANPGLNQSNRLFALQAPTQIFACMQRFQQPALPSEITKPCKNEPRKTRTKASCAPCAAPAQA